MGLFDIMTDKFDSVVLRSGVEGGFIMVVVWVYAPKKVNKN